MKTKRFLSMAFALLSTNLLFAQEPTKNFELPEPGYQIQHSHYKTISFIDSRPDTTQMGTVQVGALNKKANVICEVPLTTQLNRLMQALTDASADSGQLVLQIRQLSFYEITSFTSERGYCRLRVSLYAQKDSDYYKLDAVDTLMQTGGMDVTKATLRNGGKLITDLIARNLQQPVPETNSYKFTDLADIDNIEKRKIPVYNTDHYADGLYNSFESFCAQVPDKAIQVKTNKGGTITAVEIAGTTDKPEKIKPKETYAVVHKGQPYIATSFGFYALTKSNDEFYFTGKAKSSPDSNDVMAAGMMFGAIGVLVASTANATFLMQIDHYNGSLIPIRVIASN